MQKIDLGPTEFRLLRFLMDNPELVHARGQLLDKLWGDHVRVAVLVDNEVSTSELNINYNAVDLNKAEEDCWVVFPWEDWWK
jgi:DNA-binding response OmpR family regulator